VYDDHVWDVYGFFAYRLNSRTDAEDLTQATFERALKAWGRFDPTRASAKTWLISIASNLLIDHYRRDKSSTQTVLDEHLPDDALPVSAGPEQDLGVEPALAEALAQLNARERHIVALRFGGDLACPDIAGLLDLSVANVQQILSRCLRRMRSDLEATRDAAPPAQTATQRTPDA
jgi:RNA polymerase sigma-70 factor (ECF subfamily)